MKQAFLLLIPLCCAGVFAYAQSDKCETTTFQKIYGKPGISDLVNGSNIVETADHGFITGGWGGDIADRAVFVKVDSKGNVVWSRQFNAAGIPAATIYKFIRLKDGNYLGIGGVYSSPHMWFIKFDENGNSIWQKQLTYPGVLSAGNNNVKETPDGGFVLAGSYGIPNFVGTFIIKLDATGNVLWSRASTDILATMDMTEMNGFLFVTGYNNQGSSYITKFKSSDGSFVQCYQVIVDGQQTLLWDIDAKNNKLYICGDNRVPANDEERDFVMIMDESLNVLKVHKFYFDFDDIMGRVPISPANDGGYIMAEPREGYSDIILLRISYDGVVKWKRQYPRPGAQVTFSIIQTADNGIVGLGNSNTDESWYYIPGNDMMIFKTDSLGLMGDCNVIDPPLTVSFPAVEKIPATYTYTPVALLPQLWNDNASNIVIPVTTLCEKVATCTSIELRGETTICNLSNEIEYEVVRNVNCNAAVSWKTDPAFTSIVAVTESTLRLRFLKPGTSKVIAYLGDFCAVIADTLTVQALGVPQALSLGPDIVLCEGNTHTFHATAGFTSYRWQDGSTDTIFKASSPGTYYVTGINCEGDIFSDTVTAALAPTPVGYLKSDTAICEGQPTTISSLSDYKSYLWSSGEKTKQINIISSGLYWLQATDVNGCTARDSINVTAKAGCITALYFPSAFTPNNDGKNDLFRGIPFGYLNKYRLKIFNRYGNIIFETTDVTRGWDGNVRAKPQDTASFVWVCEYQINSQPARSEKGIVTLIR